MAKDPARGINVDDEAPQKGTHAGKKYTFCSPSCKAGDPTLKRALARFLAQFDQEQDRYAPSAAGQARREGRT
jgi:hypothetical protein